MLSHLLSRFLHQCFWLRVGYALLRCETLGNLKSSYGGVFIIFFKIYCYTGRSSNQHNKYFTHIHTFLDVYCIHALQGGNEYLFIKIHGVTSKKIVTLNIPTVRISNLTHLSLSIFLSSFHMRCNLFNSEGIVKYRAGTRFQFA
jgi:hypothetical protein